MALLVLKRLVSYVLARVLTPTLSLRAFSQSLLKTQAGLILSAVLLLLRKALSPLLRLLQLSVSVLKLSVFLALLQNRERLAQVTVILVLCSSKIRQNASHSLQVTNLSPLLRVLSVSQGQLTRLVKNLLRLSLTVLARTLLISFPESTALHM